MHVGHLDQRVSLYKLSCYIKYNNGVSGIIVVKYDKIFTLHLD